MFDKRIVAVVVVVAFVLMVPNLNKDWDISEQATNHGYEVYIQEEPDIDSTNPTIYDVALDIKKSSSSPRQAVQKTLQYVVTNIEYSSEITISYCYEETASSVLQTKVGDCVSMSRLTTALLRAQGIPARTSGGCLTSETCDILFAIDPIYEPQVTPMNESDFKKRGYLHEWVEVWIPSEGWIIVEPTSGQIFDTECESYLQYNHDTNIDRCVINDVSFWDTCYDS